MTNCRNIKADLSAFIDGELPAARQAEMRAHLDGCPGCRQQLAELRQLMAGISALPQAQPAPQFLAAVRRKIRDTEPAGRTWRTTLFFPVWPKVALEAFALLVVATGIFFVTRSGSNQPTVTVALLPKNEMVVQPESAMKARILTEERAADRSPAPPPPAAPAEFGSAVTTTERAPAPPPPASRPEKDLAQSLHAVEGIVSNQVGGPVAAADKDVHAQALAGEEFAGGGGAGGGLSQQAAALEAGLREPPQIVIVTGESLVAVKLRAESVARSLSGRVDTATSPNKLLVSLPQSKVSAFRKRMAKTTAKGTSSADYAKSAASAAPTTATLSPSTAVVAGGALVSTAAPPVEKKLPESTKQPAALSAGKRSDAAIPEPVVELEIVVEPASKSVGK